MSKKSIILLCLTIVVFSVSCKDNGINNNFFSNAYLPNKPAMISGSHKWRYLVIHHSGTPMGNAQIFHLDHVDKGWKGLAYHFVVNNGWGFFDGAVQSGVRWNEQRAGAHVRVGQNHYNYHGIGICLVGNFDNNMPSENQKRALIKLTLTLMDAYNVRSQNILGHKEIPYDKNPQRKSSTNCPGKNLRIDRFRDLMEYIASHINRDDFDSEITPLIEKWQAANPLAGVFP